MTQLEVLKWCRQQVPLSMKSLSFLRPQFVVNRSELHLDFLIDGYMKFIRSFIRQTVTFVALTGSLFIWVFSKMRYNLIGPLFRVPLTSIIQPLFLSFFDTVDNLVTGNWNFGVIWRRNSFTLQPNLQDKPLQQSWFYLQSMLEARD